MAEKFAVLIYLQMINSHKFLEDAKEFNNQINHSSDCAGILDAVKEAGYNININADNEENTDKDVIYTLEIRASRMKKRTRLIQIIELRGENTILDLYNHLKCQTRFISKDENWFCVMDYTVYNQMPAGLDSWWKSVQETDELHPVPPLSIAPANTKFIDLTVRIRRPYLLHHDLDCGHSFIISSIRIENCIETYPKTLFCEKFGYLMCICNVNKATRHAEGTNFCNACFKEFFGAQTVEYIELYQREFVDLSSLPD
jgi:hypothetical protein